jgi:alpha-1,3-mannosyltransferase
VAKKYEKLYEAAIGTQVRTILEVPVQVRTFNEAAEMIDSRFDKGKQLTVAFANAHALNVAAKNSDFRKALQNSIVFNDGVGMDIAGKILFGAFFRENLNGTDFVPNYLRHTRHRYRVFLLGARPGVAERAAHRLSMLNPNHRICGYHHGHFDIESAAKIAELIRKSEPDILLVAMGNPKQELYLQVHLAATGCRLGIGVGALFDFLAGEVPRAGPRIQKARLEWVFRLAQEPGRLARRYLLGNPLFICRVLVQWWSGSRVQSGAPLPDFGSDIQAPELAASAWQTTQA